MLIPLLLSLALQANPPIVPPVHPPRTEQEVDVTEVVRPKHVQAVTLFDLLGHISGQFTVNYSSTLDVLTVTGTKERVEEVLKLISNLDVVREPEPSTPQIEYRIRLLAASENPKDDARDKFDDELKGVVAKLSKHFKFAAYSEIDSVLGRANAGSAVSLKPKGFILGLESYMESEQAVSVSKFSLCDTSSERSRMGGMGGDILRTNFTLKPGQTTVVGVTRSGDESQSIIVVITATVEK